MQRREPPHYDPGRLDAYFAGVMPEREAEMLERHLGSCPTCMAAAGRLSRSLWALETFTADSHRSAVLRDQVSESLQRAVDAPANRDIEEHLRSWLRRWEGLASAAFRLTVQKGEQTVTAIQSLLYPEPLHLEYSPAGGPLRRRGKVDGPEASKGQPPPIRFRIQRQASGAVVWVDRLPPGASPLLMLIAADGKAEPAIALLAPAAADSEFEWKATFTAAPPGDCILLFGPHR